MSQRCKKHRMNKNVSQRKKKAHYFNNKTGSLDWEKNNKNTNITAEIRIT